MLSRMVLDRRRDTKETRESFAATRKAEMQFARNLRSIARHIGDLTRVIYTGTLESARTLEEALRRYAAGLHPWAQASAARMLADVSRRDEAVWNRMASNMSRQLKTELKTAPIGAAMQALMQSQVGLITSLPREAAERVHKLAHENLFVAGRGENIVKEIMRTGEVTKSRATLIARTETARTASVLTRVRAQHVGREGYIWRTSEDSDVRPTHRKLNGKFIRWDDPPVSEADGITRAHAGTVYNCRCWPEPVIPEEPEDE